MALAMCKRPLINPADHDNSLEGLTDHDFSNEINGSRVYDPATKKIVVQFAVVLCELGSILAQLPVPPNLPQQSAIEQHEVPESDIEESLERLSSWYQKTYLKFRLAALLSAAHESLTLFSNITYTYYQYVIFTLRSISENDARHTLAHLW